jgi:hypothetical protein
VPVFERKVGDCGEEVVDNHCMAFEKYIQDPMNLVCSSCRRRLFAESSKGYDGKIFCFSCQSKVKSGQQSSICLENNMDPGEIPPELKVLTKIEKRFTALIHVFMTVFFLPRKEQMGTRGMAINIPAQPHDLLHGAGTSPAVFVSFESREGTDYDFSHFVSVLRIAKALKWLKENNGLYSGVEIPESCLAMVEQDVANGLSSEDRGDIEESLAIGVDEHIPVHENVRISERLKRIRLPRVEGNIVNAYQMTGGEEMCFPWLFPFGKAGYSDERVRDSRFDQLYPKARFLGEDDRFRKDNMYLLHFANVYERRMLLNSVSIHLQMRANQRSINLGDLNSFDFSSQSYMFMKNVRGTAGYFKNESVGHD